VRAAWLVRGKDGKDAARAEQPAEPKSALKGVVVDRAIPLPAGDYDVAFVLLDAGGAVVSAARRSVVLAPASPELAASPLLLAVADLPAEGASVDAPFVVAGRRFVSRGDGRILTSDGLSYLVRLYGPGVDPATKKALIKRKISIQPKGGSPIDLPSAPDEPVSMSDGAAGGVTVLDLAGTVADGNIGEYFRPGEYTFRVILEDAVRKTKVEVSEALTIVARGK
jgi:hypothetical protein